MKVLMGIDDSKLSEDAIQAVVTQLRPENTEVLVLHVLEPISLLAPPEMAQGYAPELEERKKPAHELVERFATKLRGAGFEASTAVEIGDVRVTILDTATEWHADLIVVGSHGRKGIERFLLGSVTESVARHAKCSVEIVRASG
jgi:nucleotide-binding universal stress UspA family protein